MEDVTRDLLQEEIEQLFRSLNKLEPGSKEYASAVEDLNKLYKLKIEEIENDWAYDEKYNVRAMEEKHQARELEIKEAQLKEQITDRYFKCGVEVGLTILSLAFYAAWMNRGFKFEETGTYTSKTFMGLFNRFRPTRK